MEYIVKFNFSTIKKNGLITGKSGECSITSDGLPSELVKSHDLIMLIAKDMNQKTKQSILNVDITEITLKT